MSSEREFGVDQDQHEAQHHQKNQRQATLSPLLVLELPTPLDAIVVGVEFDLLIHVLLSFRKQGREVAIAVVKFYGQMPLVPLMSDRAFAGLETDAGHLRQR